MKMSFAVLTGAMLLAPALTQAADGALTVTVSAPAAQSSVPRGAQRVTMLTVTLTADCVHDVAISSLEVRHAGLGAVSDFSRLYLLEGVTRVSRGAVPSDRAGTMLRLKKFTVPACQSRTLAVAVDVSPVASPAAEHRFSVSAVSADASVTIGEAITKKPTLVVTPSVTAADIDSEFLPVHTSQLYGSNRTLARFRLTNNGARTAGVSAITFTNDGSAREADLQNLGLYSSSGDLMSDLATQLEGRIVRLTITPALSLSSRDEKVLELRGDVRASRRRTIDFTIEEPSDIEASEIRSR